MSRTGDRWRWWRCGGKGDAVSPYYRSGDIAIFCGSAESLPLEDATVQTCVTSPPYWGLRDYGVDGQIGLEETPEAYVARLVTVFREVRRVLKDDGTLWLNIGDTFSSNSCTGRKDKFYSNGTGIIRSGDKKREGYKPQAINRVTASGLVSKQLLGMPWRLAFAMQADGWILRSDIIWGKSNPMPEPCVDRPWRSHEYLFLFSKSPTYLCEVPETNRLSVWSIPLKPYPGAHFATFPPDLIEPCIKAGSRPGDLVLDPFNGSGTTGEVCRKWGRRYVGMELNPAYIDLSAERFRQGVLFAAGGAA